MNKPYDLFCESASSDGRSGIAIWNYAMTSADIYRQSMKKIKLALRRGLLSLVISLVSLVGVRYFLPFFGTLTAVVAQLIFLFYMIVLLALSLRVAYIKCLHCGKPIQGFSWKIDPPHICVHCKKDILSNDNYQTIPYKNN